MLVFVSTPLFFSVEEKRACFLNHTVIKEDVVLFNKKTENSKDQ